MGTNSDRRGLHITVGVSPGSGGLQELLAHDIRLAKAAVLYADRTTLVSFSSTVIADFAVVAHGSEHDQQRALKEMLWIATVQQNQQLAALIAQSDQIGEQLRHGQYVPADKRHWYRQFQQRLVELSSETRERFQRLIEDAGTAELETAMRAGLLEVEPLEELEGTNPDQWVAVYADHLQRVLSDATAYPLFDELIGNVVHHGIKEGMFQVTPAGEARGRRSALAANLLERLPLFEQATMDEILHIRSELDRPLRKFRSAVAEFSEEIERAAWDPDFVFDAQDTFEKKVAPAVDEIEEAVKANSLLTNILDRAAEKPAAAMAGVTGLAAGLGMAMTPAIPDLLAVSAVGASSFSVSWPAFRDWSDESREIEKNNLFFYYKAGELLTKGAKR